MTEEEKNYLLDHGAKYMLPEEKKALARIDFLKHGVQPYIHEMYKEKMEKAHRTPDAKADALVALGEEVLNQQIAERLFTHHKDQILNTCPRCEKLARTPLAKQCRHCGFDWH